MPYTGFFDGSLSELQQKVKNDILTTLSKLERMEEKAGTEISALEDKFEELLVNG